MLQWCFRLSGAAGCVLRPCCGLLAEKFNVVLHPKQLQLRPCRFRQKSTTPPERDFNEIDDVCFRSAHLDPSCGLVECHRVSFGNGPVVGRPHTPREERGAMTCVTGPAACANHLAHTPTHYSICIDGALLLSPPDIRNHRPLLKFGPQTTLQNIHITVQSSPTNSEATAAQRRLL